MNITSLFAFTPRIGRLLATAAAVFAIGLLNPPAIRVAMAATTPVAVDQSPLTLRQQIPPNITLMLDDSGSMRSDVMPDEQYVGANPGAPTQSELTSSDVNGVYYNPNTNYGPPVQVDGTQYPAASFTGAWINGFNHGAGTVNLSSYDGSSDTTWTGAAYHKPSDIHYTQSFSVTTSSTPYTPTNCPSGYLLVGSQCQKQPYKASCIIGYSLQLTKSNGYQCVSNTNRNKTQTPTCQGSDTYSSATGMCTPNPPVYTAPSCNSSSDVYDPSTNLCTPQSQSTYSFFTYTVKNSDGSFTSHYVGLNGTCAPVVAAGDITSAANCDESATTQQNVANWYSYYHTRILMAKSSLMVAFDQVNPSFRIGFGSINNNGASNLSNTFGTAPEIQQVAPFDVNCATSPATCTPGQSGTTRASFWKWVTSEYANNSTPLRIALDQVGQYYQSSQPWTTMSTDPGYGLANQPSSISCRQAYTILTTDGFWNDSFTGPGNTDDTNGTQINGANGQSYTYTAALPYSDSYGDTLADVAMKYWGTDLQTGIANNVPPSSSDPAFWQHMTTFTIGLGFTPTGISPTGTTVPQIFNWANGGASINNFAWPQPSADSINNIADLAHAGLNGHGGFFSATDPTSFVSGLSTALNRATDRVGTGASLAANSTQLQTGTAVFQANYFTGNWKGDLKELGVNANDGTIATKYTWSAEYQLANSVCTTDSTTGAMTCGNRKIWTYNPTSGKFVAFTASIDSSGTVTLPALSSTQLGTFGSTATAQANVINYLRGDNTLEQKNGGGFRDRDWPLGDIVDSQPVYEGTPNANEFVNMSFAGYTYDPNNTTCTSCSPFQDWAVGTTDTSNNFTASAASQRRGVVWVSGNDGMIHAFDATTGNEVYAYLPGALMIKSTDPYLGGSNPLANLADPSYGSTSKPHQFYNDGELTIADAYVQLSQTGDTGPQWHTILVGTTGRGPARAVYALDVTDPTNVTPLWERYNGDSSSLDSNSGYIGQMVGKPVIAQTGDYGTTPAWSVLIGNGYNSTNGTAALLQFDLATGQLYVHATDSATSNGLAAPLAWMNTPSSGMADVAYAGDLLGRVWSIPLISVSTSGGNSGNSTTSYTPSPSAGGVKLFTATNASGTAQPITAGMWGAQEPNTGSPTPPNPNSVWLFFGTGKYLTQADITDASVQSWYGIMAQTTAGNGPLSAYSRTSSKMIQRNIIAEQAGSSSPFQLPVRAVTAPTPTSDPYSTTDMKGMNGWVMDLESPNSSGTVNSVAQGERIVAPGQLQGNLLIGTTRIPKPAGDITDPCNPAGYGWIMAVNPFSGTGPITNFFDTNNNGSINGSDTITLADGTTVSAAGVGFTSLPNAPIFVGGDMLVSFDNGTTSSLKTTSSSGGYSRVSWQELITP